MEAPAVRITFFPRKCASERPSDVNLTTAAAAASCRRGKKVSAAKIGSKSGGRQIPQSHKL